jgi:hypothetical protein
MYEIANTEARARERWPVATIAACEIPAIVPDLTDGSLAVVVIAVIRIDHDISDDNWRTLVDQARQAAEHSERKWMLLRLPSQLCSDGGRAINASRTDWPKTLRGEAAEIYLRWQGDLKPYGFGISANVLDFPAGIPGDTELFLVRG